MRKPLTATGAAVFFAQLEQALAALPSAEEQRLLEGLEKVRSLVGVLRRGIEALPAEPSVAEQRRALGGIRAFLERAEQDPLLSSC